jgi:3-hydroxybutyryl-CoA dehydrogenase
MLEHIKSVGVVGSGLMGLGIAQVVATAGFPVTLCDISEEAVNRGYQQISKQLAKDVAKGKKEQATVDQILGNIVTTCDYGKLADVDMVFEAVFEKMEVKKDLYTKLDAICKPACIFATNTSGLSITEIASVTKRCDKVVGTHFFNPVPVMKLLELVRGYDTSDETFRIALEMGAKIGKETISVKEAPLFCVNRILVPMINEAMFVFAEGIASAEDIDTGMMLGANHPIGPLALADLVGLDTLLLVMQTLYQETCDSKYRPCPLLVQLVRAGHFGRKTRQGIYKYD